MSDYKKVQINLLVPSSWKEKIQKIARLKSVEIDETVSYLDLIRDVMIKEFELSGSL